MKVVTDFDHEFINNLIFTYRIGKVLNVRFNLNLIESHDVLMYLQIRLIKLSLVNRRMKEGVIFVDSN